MSYKIKLTIDGAEREVQCFTTNYFLINPIDKMLISPESAEGKKITSDFLSGHSKLSSAEYYAWKYSLLDGFNKNLPWNSMPNNKAIAGGAIVVILESTSDDDAFYFGLKDSPMYSGSLEVFISKKDEDIPFRKIEFWDAYIVDISEYAGKNEEAMYMGCVISPGIVRYNKNVVHKKPWHVTDIEKKEPIPVVVEDVIDEKKEVVKYNIIVDEKYRTQFKNDLHNVFGDKASSFSFNSEGYLILNGKEKEFTEKLSKDGEKLFKGIKKIKTTTVVYEDVYDLTINKKIKTTDVVVEFGGGLYSKTDNLIVIANSVGAVDVDLDIFPFPKERVEQNTTSTLFHEIGEVNTKNLEYRGAVIEYENYARKIIGLSVRPTDLNHSNTIKTNYKKD